ncbi:pilin [Actinoplanes sp. GCM10030250]|uniref:pilin n=1 Tax=Actinoplanes sp. GCM10030250 TaxID=3273376 RepID=UPI0036139337
MNHHRPLHRPTPTPRRPITDRPGRRLRRTARRFAPAVAVTTSTVIAVALIPDAAYAAVESIPQVVDRIRLWLVGILVAVATLFLTVGGLRYAAANGDPGEVEKAKLALKSAAIGYGLAMLAPLFVTIVGQWVA